jgi:hypothetical protein
MAPFRRTRLGGNATPAGLSMMARRRVLKLSSRSGHENSDGANPIAAHGGEGGRHLAAAMRDLAVNLIPRCPSRRQKPILSDQIARRAPAFRLP